MVTCEPVLKKKKSSFVYGWGSHCGVGPARQPQHRDGDIVCFGCPWSDVHISIFSIPFSLAHRGSFRVCTSMSGSEPPVHFQITTSHGVICLVESGSNHFLTMGASEPVHLFSCYTMATSNSLWNFKLWSFSCKASLTLSGSFMIFSGPTSSWSKHPNPYLSPCTWVIIVAEFLTVIKW